jgi:hypothetical protein
MSSTAMTHKKRYEKPTTKVFPLTAPNRLLVGSGDPEWRDIPGGPEQF